MFLCIIMIQYQRCLFHKNDKRHIVEEVNSFSSIFSRLPWITDKFLIPADIV